MKSILALLCLAVVANALTDKSGGLKGSWTEVVTLTSTDDILPPAFADGGYTNSLSLYCADFFNDGTNKYTLNTTDSNYYYYYCDQDTMTLYFSLSGELDWESSIGFSDQFALNYVGGVTATYWSGTDMSNPDATIPGTCTIDYYNDVTCMFGISRHMMAGTYALYITAWDGNGNWASYTAADFSDDPTFVLMETYPDTTAPVISALSAVTGSPVALDGTSLTPFDNDVSTGSVNIMVVATDGYSGYYDTMPMTDANYDPMASQVASVWVTIQMGLTATTDNTVTWMVMDQNTEVNPSTGASSTDTGYWLFSNDLVFFPVFDPATWYVTGYSAMDYAGNTGTMTVSAADGIIDVTYDRSALDAAGGVFSCQTLTATSSDGISAPAPSVTATATDYIYLSAGCTLKGTALDGYVGVGYQSDTYTPAGQTADMMYTFWSESTRTPVGAADSNWLMGMGTTYCYQDTGYTYSYCSEALGTDSLFGIWGGSVYFAPAAPAGDYYLYLVLTITPEGGVQSYSLADGAASALAPSMFALFIAAIVALLRL